MQDFPFADVDFDPDDIESVEVVTHDKAVTGRSLARRLALQALYEIDTTDHSIEDVIGHFLARGNDTLNIDVLFGSEPTKRIALVDLIDDKRTLEDEETRILEYFQHLVRHIVALRGPLDAILGRFAPDFPIDAIAVVDRNTLRIALWEMAVDTRVPMPVAIDEAIELAKLFGSDASPRFVNGVLGTIGQNLRGVRETLREMSGSLGETISAQPIDSDP